MQSLPSTSFGCLTYFCPRTLTTLSQAQQALNSPRSSPLTPQLHGCCGWGALWESANPLHPRFSTVNNSNTANARINAATALFAVRSFSGFVVVEDAYNFSLQKFSVTAPASLLASPPPDLYLQVYPSTPNKLSGCGNWGHPVTWMPVATCAHTFRNTGAATCWWIWHAHGIFLHPSLVLRWLLCCSLSHSDLRRAYEQDLPPCATSVTLAWAPTKDLFRKRFIAEGIWAHGTMGILKCTNTSKRVTRKIDTTTGCISLPPIQRTASLLIAMGQMPNLFHCVGWEHGRQERAISLKSWWVVTVRNLEIWRK